MITFQLPTEMMQHREEFGAGPSKPIQGPQVVSANPSKGKTPGQAVNAQSPTIVIGPSPLVDHSAFSALQGAQQNLQSQAAQPNQTATGSGEPSKVASATKNQTDGNAMVEGVSPRVQRLQERLAEAQLRRQIAEEKKKFRHGNTSDFNRMRQRIKLLKLQGVPHREAVMQAAREENERMAGG